MAAVDIITEKLISMNLLTTSVSGRTAALADDELLSAANVLWNLLVQRSVHVQVSRELASRNLLPVTLRTLSVLLYDAISQYKQC
jgi:hypothetical protein